VEEVFCGATVQKMKLNIWGIVLVVIFHSPIHQNRPFVLEVKRREQFSILTTNRMSVCSAFSSDVSFSLGNAACCSDDVGLSPTVMPLV
jgi:hypothetical protein